MPPLPPRYSLGEIQAQMNCVGELVMTDTAFSDMLSLKLGKPAVVRIVQALTPAHFYKSMPSTKYPDCFQDVYRTTYQYPDSGEQQELYVKFMQDPEVATPVVGDFILVSFKDK